MILALILLLVGGALILAEVFFPSLGMLGLMAGVAILLADIQAFEHGGPVVGWTFIAIEVIGIPLLVRAAFRILPRLPFGKRMILSASSEPPGAGLPEHARLIGQHGVAETDLRPGGTARFGEQRVSVVSTSTAVARGTPIWVVATTGPEIRVEPLPVLPPSHVSPETP